MIFPQKSAYVASSPCPCSSFSGTSCHVYNTQISSIVCVYDNHPTLVNDSHQNDEPWNGRPRARAAQLSLEIRQMHANFGATYLPPPCPHTMEARTDHSADPMFWENMFGGLSNAEFFWRDHYTFLEEKGYTLRPRYSPDWKPSWLSTKRKPIECEDGQPPFVSPSAGGLGSRTRSSC